MGSAPHSLLLSLSSFLSAYPPTFAVRSSHSIRGITSSGLLERTKHNTRTTLPHTLPCIHTTLFILYFLLRAFLPILSFLSFSFTKSCTLPLAVVISPARSSFYFYFF